MLLRVISATVKEEVGKYVRVMDMDVKEIEIEGKKYRVDFVKEVAPKVFKIGSSNYVFLVRIEDE